MLPCFCMPILLQDTNIIIIRLSFWYKLEIYNTTFHICYFTYIITYGFKILVEFIGPILEGLMRVF